MYEIIAYKRLLWTVKQATIDPKNLQATVVPLATGVTCLFIPLLSHSTRLYKVPSAIRLLSKLRGPACLVTDSCSSVRCVLLIM